MFITVLVKHMKKNILTTTVLLLTFFVYSQNNTDYLIDQDNNKIFCKIIQIKNGKIKYRLNGKSYSVLKDITNFKDLSFTDKSIIKATFDPEIEKPEKGYAYIYFYSAKQRPYTVLKDKNKITKIGVNNYYLLKVKANETHVFHCEGNSNEQDF